MKLTKNWQNNKSPHKPKRVGSKPRKLPVPLLGLPGGSREEKVSHSIDEVRRQAVLMSSGGFRAALPPSPASSPAKGHKKNKQQKKLSGTAK